LIKVTLISYMNVQKRKVLFVTDPKLMINDDISYFKKKIKIK